ncbi:MAG: hypothetical protein PWQ10_88 [Patescibacteria group bacterium]|nr:hypothetical protein [Patescibacteria group bacterium]
MSNNPEQSNHNQENNIEVQKSAANQLEKIQNKSETSIELSPRDKETQSERARKEALESAVSVEAGGSEIKKAKKHSISIKRGQISKKAREESYSRTMKQVQSELPPINRAFSKFIHNKVIEKTTDVIGGTIARPNAMFCGAFFAFLLTLMVYVIAKKIGYLLSGFETILAFIVGWALGIIYDYFHILFTGKK